MTVLVAIAAVLVPASVTLVGLVYTRQSHNEENARLRLDAAMRAAELFGGDNESVNAASNATNASGLLALAELGQADLAVALLVDLWSADSDVSDGEPSVSTETAILLINAALKDTERATTPLIAAELLCRNAHRLDPCQSLHWPAAVDGCWIAGLSPRAKLLLLEGLIIMTTTSAASENALRSLLVRLYGVWSNDPSLRVQGCVGTLLASVMPAVERLGYEEFMQGNETVVFTQLKCAAASASPNPDGYLERLVSERAATLARWSLKCTSCSFYPGALATAWHQF